MNAPSNWRMLTVGDVAEYINGLAFKPSDWGSEGRPIVRIQNLTNREAPFNYTTRGVEDRYVVRAGDILVSWSATLDAFRWSGPNAVLNQHIFRVIPNLDVVDPSFLFYGLRRAILEMGASEHLHGSTMKHINRAPFMAHPFAVPSIEVQRHIVAKLDALLERRSFARDELKQVPTLVGRFRQSVLAAALRGDLTADWRKQHPDGEPASKLLERIRIERRAAWEAAELAKMRAKRKLPKDDKWKGNYVEPERAEPRGFPQLPSSWCWATLSEVASLQLGQRRAPEFAKERQFPYIRAANITWDGLDLTDVKTMGFANPSGVSLLPGDVLLSEASGSPTEVGKPALWNGEIRDCCFQATVLRVRSASPALVGGAWLYVAFLRNALLGDFAAMAPGVGILHLTAERMRSWPIPLAPVDEQIALGKRVQMHLKRARQLSQQMGACRHSLAVVDRAFLAKAFSGRLLD